MDRIGVLFTLAAYLLWGLFPLYFHALQDVSALEILAHRIVWSLVVTAAILMALRRGEWIRGLVKEPRTLAIFTGSALLIGLNWGTYVYSIVSGQTIEASLGYFINPLMSVALGALFLGERLSKAQLGAVALAAAGVLYITISTGTAPFLGLVLAASFALYGLIRKLAPLGSLEGMALENVILAPFALGYMFWLLERGELLFATEGWDVKTLLLLAGPITTIPLLLFASGVRRIPYSTVGIIQYVSPTIVFLLGRFAFGEPFSVEMMTGFVLIWTAVVVFTVDTVRTTARLRREINRRRQRTADRRRQAGRRAARHRVGERHLGARHVGVGLHDRKAEARARKPGTRDAVEGIEDARTLLGRNAGARVGHAHHEALGRARDAKRHGSARGRVVEGVFKKVSQNRQQGRRLTPRRALRRRRQGPRRRTAGPCRRRSSSGARESRQKFREVPGTRVAPEDFRSLARPARVQTAGAARPA